MTPTIILELITKQFNMLDPIQDRQNYSLGSPMGFIISMASAVS